MTKAVRKTLIIICVVLFSVFAFSSLFMIFNKNDNDNNSQSVDWSNITISCLGDSITYGQGVDKSYPTLLKETLGLKTCVNYGIPWSTCSVVNNCSCHSGVSNAHNAMCLRYSSMPKTSDIIIVMCGVNDAGLVSLGNMGDTGSSTFYGSLDILCKGLKNKYSNSFIVFMTSFNYEISNAKNDFGCVRKDYYQTAVKEVCQKYNFNVFDTFNLVRFNTASDTVDNVHPNQNFVSNVWTPQIAQYLKDNYKK